MRLTPLDIQSHRFSSRLRGLDPVEVEAFLQLVGEDYESLMKERDGMAQELRRLRARLEELERAERVLQDTLITAQTLSEDLKKTALKESEILLSQAEVKAEKILAASHRRAARLAEDIREMKMMRVRIGAAIRQAIDTHLVLLDSLSEPDPSEEEDGKVAYLARAKSTQDEG